MAKPRIYEQEIQDLLDLAQEASDEDAAMRYRIAAENIIADGFRTPDYLVMQASDFSEKLEKEELTKSNNTPKEEN